MQVREIIKRPVTTVAPHTPLRDAARCLSLFNLASVPVCDGRRLVGLLTSRDLTMRATAEGRNPWTSTVSEVMTREVICVRPDQSVEEAAALMRQQRLGELPVVDAEQRLVGVIGENDLPGHSPRCWPV